MKNTIRNIKLISGIIFLILIVIIFFLDEISTFIFPYAEKYFSPNQNIEHGIEGVYQILLIIIVFCLIFFIGILLLPQNIYFSKLKNYFFNDSLKIFFLFEDNNFESTLFNPKNALIFSTILALVFWFLNIFSAIPVIHMLHGEDRFLEYLTSVLFLVSSILVSFSLIRYNKNINRIDPRPWLKLVLIFIIIISFFLAMEEVSWGQRIFDWDTTQDLTGINFQNETNLHNYFNPLLNSLYPLSGISFFLLLIIGWIPLRNSKSSFFRFVFPHPSLFFIVLIMMLSSIEGHSDLFEQLSSVFMVLYSFRILLYLKSFSKSEEKII